MDWRIHSELAKAECRLGALGAEYGIQIRNAIKRQRFPHSPSTKYRPSTFVQSGPVCVSVGWRISTRHHRDKLCCPCMTIDNIAIPTAQRFADGASMKNVANTKHTPPFFGRNPTTECPLGVVLAAATVVCRYPSQVKVKPELSVFNR